MSEVLRRIAVLHRHNLGRPGERGVDRLREGSLALYRRYCEGGCSGRTIGAAQPLPAKPTARPKPLLGRFNA